MLLIDQLVVIAMFLSPLMASWIRVVRLAHVGIVFL